MVAIKMIVSKKKIIINFRSKVLKRAIMVGLDKKFGGWDSIFGIAFR